jgi:cytochrome c biogenesis protein CcmG/thiol:disulfide interchange protein DsbE
VNIKKYLSISNFLVLVIISILFYTKYPQIKENFISQGQTITDNFQLVEFRTAENIPFPSNQKQVVVFWATWCGPCKVELARLQNLVENKKINPQQVLAVSLDENVSMLRDFLKNTNYGFLVVHDTTSQLGQKFNIFGTPTILLIDENNEVQWRTTGISPTLEVRVLSFF